MPLSNEEQGGILAKVLTIGCPMTGGDRLAYYERGIRVAIAAMAPAVSLDEAEIPNAAEIAAAVESANTDEENGDADAQNDG